MSTKVTTVNQLEAKSFRLIIDRIPNVEYFCTSASVPGITATAVRQPNPFTDIKVTGDKLVFQPLIVNFLVNEDMSNWEEIFNWMVSYSHPTSFEEYKDNRQTQHQLYPSKKSDAKLLIPNNMYNYSTQTSSKPLEFSFIDVFPIDLSDTVFDVQIDGTTSMISTVTFEYTSYKKTA